jgi:hypothetical protein
MLSMADGSGFVDLYFVDVAPFPVLAGLDRTHDGVLGGEKVLGGVLVLRRIAATDVAAEKTHAEMHPGISHFEALLATFRIGMDLVYVFEMRAGTGHRLLSSR